MRVQTEEWRRFIPGVRMYRGKKTLFWNGEKLWDDENGEYLVYDEQGRISWEVIIVLPGVELIPRNTFSSCEKIETVIMSDESVRRIETLAFYDCTSLSYVRLSRNLEFIGLEAFFCCDSLPSIFIPPSCREIVECAFEHCLKLIIFSVSRHTELDDNVIAKTELIEASPFTTDNIGFYDNNDEVNEWIKNRHADNQFSLHRACSSYNPLDVVIFDIVKREGLKAFKKSDSVGVTPSQYLSENPFAEVEEQKMIKRYILDMMGEVI
ncbi:leucine-rich repeat domain-containing protein [Chaetoceros tenuissimus]|uniref:Leucine-rich repeat domain-containing protein n=1 Tax=Chaetoceros tenuissimus TaxID=426638 RepID=A0AAD3CHH6_9STRA|nr:leucine-rich repeat domain-containing protein [Chaetoceros tenuissimus]